MSIHVSSGKQSGRVASWAFTPPSTVQTGAVDFRTLLGRLFNKTTDLLQKYADPDVKEITIEGFGTFRDKSSAAVQMAISVSLTNTETQLNTSLSYLDFIYKTLPQMLERSI